MLASLVLDPAARNYLEELTARLRAALDPLGVYLVGSGARGGYEPGRSDLDVLAVVRSPLTSRRHHEVVERCRHEALPCPARKLELVVYGPDGATVELNLNTGPDEFVDEVTEWFWFAVDRAIARETAKPLLGPPPAEAIAAPDDETLRRALREMVAWYEANEPGEAARVARARADAWLERGEWVTKRDVAPR
jgi:hypothetical protein